MWVLLFQKYGKIWSVLLEHFIKHKPLFSEESILWYCIILLLGPCTSTSNNQISNINSAGLNKYIYPENSFTIIWWFALFNNLAPINYVSKFDIVYEFYLYTVILCHILKKSSGKQMQNLSVTCKNLSAGIRITTYYRR